MAAMNRSLVSLRSVTLEDAPHLAEVWTDVIRRVGPEDQAPTWRR